MALKRLNHQWNLLPSDEESFSSENEAHLHCLLKETIINSRPEDFINNINELPSALNNLRQVILKCDPKSGPFGKCIELTEKIIMSLKERPNMLHRIEFLPILTEVLLRSDVRHEHILKLIQDVSFGIHINSHQSYLDRLIKFCLDILCSEMDKHDIKIKTVALSVLINLCSHNPIPLKLLELQINLVDLQKKIPLDVYGILACKMNMVVYDCGHIIRDIDVLNFLKFTMKELHHIQSLDEKSLKHSIGFIRDISERPNTCHILQQFDFELGIKSAFLSIESSTCSDITIHTNSLFELIKIVMAVKNNSLNKLLITITNFAIKRLKGADCCTQALELLSAIFNHDVLITERNFDLEELREILNAMLYCSDRQSTIMAPLFKVLNALARNYKINLIKNQLIESIFAPLLQLDQPKYVKLPISDITMYLECLSTLSTLSDGQQFETKPDIFQEPNVHFLVAMSIKHGSIDQSSLALSLVNRFSYTKIAEIVASKDNDFELNNPQIALQKIETITFGKDLSKETSSERVKNVFFNIEEKCIAEKIDAPTSDFIELYTNEIAMLKRKIQALTKQNEILSESYQTANNELIGMEITSMKWSELAQNLQRTNETLTAEIEKFNTIVTSMKTKYKKQLVENDESITKLTQEKVIASKKIKELEEKVESLEDELNDIEDLRQTVVSLMSKRKKTNKDK